MQQPFSILYLDDEVDNLTAFRAVFRRYFEVHVAENADDAMRILEANAIDLVISDQRMPDTTGVEFLEQVFRQFPQALRMILTGYSDMQAIIEAINRGKIYHYITKPWKFEELKLVIDNAMETSTLRRRNHELEAEKLALELKSIQQEKEHITSRYEVLKNQVNPHFLFNALNTLASLISSDPAGALRFATRFAKMYRNLLEFGASQLIPLARELDMIDNYFYLQSIRFGDDLRLEKRLENLHYLLPPFALQLLVENAIKHNSVGPGQALNILIQSEADGLLVRNNLQLRQSTEQSMGIGLRNLQQRYLLLTGLSIEYGINGEYFDVHIPLIPEL
jgi:sensor histidine kinase YesM